MNKWIGMGRLTRDPEVRYSQGNEPMAIARFSLAVDRKFKRDGEPTADFINCVAFKKTAETIEKYCRKGTKLAIEGRIQTGSYTNKDGVKVYTTDVMVESLEFAESRSADNQNNSQETPQASPFGSVPTDADGFMSIPDNIDEELPF